MAVSREEALSFVKVLSTGKPAVHLEALLGLNGVATVDDFDNAASDDAALMRCEDFVATISHYADALEALYEVQKSKAEKADANEKANTIPGIPPAPRKRGRPRKGE